MGTEDRSRSGAVRVEMDSGGDFSVPVPPRLDGATPDPRTERLRQARERRDTATGAPLQPTLGTAPDPELESDDGPSVGPDAKGPLLALIVVLLALIGFLLWGAKPEEGRTASNEPIVAPTTTTIPEATEPNAGESDPLDSPGQPPEVVAVNSVREPIITPIHFKGSWFALQGQTGTFRLVTSVDGLNWTVPDVALPTGALWGLGEQGDDLIALHDSGVAAEGAYQLSTWITNDGEQWVQRTGDQLAGDGDVTLTIISDEGILVPVQQQNQSPVAEVSEMLVELGLDPEAAAQTCQIIRDRFDNSNVVFSALGCDGTLLGEISDVASLVDDRLSFAAEILDYRFGITVAPTNGDTQQAAFPPAVAPGSIVATTEGFLAISVDARPALDDPNLFFAQGTPARMQRWTPELGFVDVEPGARLNAWWSTSLVAQKDGGVLHAIADEVYLGYPPFEEWTLVEKWTPEGIRTGQIAVVPGNEWLSRVDPGEGTFWVTAAGGSWQPIRIRGTSVSSVLLSTETSLIVVTVDRRLIEIPTAELGDEVVIELNTTTGSAEVLARPLESREWSFPVLTEGYAGDGFVGLSNENGSTLFFESADGLVWDGATLTNLPFSLFVRRVETTDVGYRLFGRLGMFDDAIFVSNDGLQWSREEVVLPRGAGGVELAEHSASGSARAVYGSLGWPDDLSRTERFLLSWDINQGPESAIDVPLRPCTEPNGRCDIASVAATDDGVIVVHLAEQRFTLSKWTQEDGWRQVPADLPLPADPPQLMVGQDALWYIAGSRVLASEDGGETWEDRFVAAALDEATFVQVSRDGSVALLESDSSYIVATEAEAIRYDKGSVRSFSLQSVSAEGVVFNGVDGESGQAIIRLDAP